MLDDVLGELKERERVAILLRYFEKMPLAEVGAKLSLSETAARSCVDRALDKMRGLLARRGVDSTVTALTVVFANHVGAAAPVGLVTSVTSAALAQASLPASTGVLGLLKIMSATKTITIVASVVAILAVGSAVYEAGLRSAAETERDSLRTRLTSTELQAAALKQEASAARTTLDATTAATSSRTPPPNAQRSPAAQTPTSFSPFENAVTRKIAVAQMSPQLAAFYGSFAVKHSLTPEQLNGLIALLQEKYQTALDARAVSPGSKVTPDVKNAIQPLQAQIDDKIHSLLGDQTYQDFQQFNVSSPERRVADDLNGLLTAKGNNLTGEQSDRLTQLLLQSSTMNPNIRNLLTDPAAAPGAPRLMSALFQADTLALILADKGSAQNPPSGILKMVLASPMLTDDAIAQARSFLSPPQIESLQELQTLQKSNVDLANTLLKRTTPPTPAQGAPPPPR